MKHMFKVFGIIAFMLIIGFVMIGCDNPSGGGNDDDTPIDNGDDTPPDPVMYTVWFDFNNGSEPETQTIVSGGTAVIPEEPSNGVHLLFDGWFTADNTPFSAETTVSANITVYARWRPYAIGETGPAGGLIFFDKGSVSNDWRYLEAAPAETELPETEMDEDVEWGAEGSFIGVTQTDVGSGKENTRLIVEYLDNNDETGAAKVCDMLVFGGKDDWFLPSQDELDLMYDNLYNAIPSLGDFQANDYWSSSELNNDNPSIVFTQDFSDGVQNRSHKGNAGTYVRAIRQF
jgi:uncharacterized repeat protein (TIGR02543 family)